LSSLRNSQRHWYTSPSAFFTIESGGTSFAAIQVTLCLGFFSCSFCHCAAESIFQSSARAKASVQTAGGHGPRARRSAFAVGDSHSGGPARTTPDPVSSHSLRRP